MADAALHETFANPEAKSVLDERVAELADEVSELLDSGPDADPDQLGETQLMPFIEIITALCERLPAKPPHFDEVSSWRTQYLRRWDRWGLQVVGGSDEAAEARRRAICTTLDRLEALSRRFWTGPAATMMN